MKLPNEEKAQAIADLLKGTLHKQFEDASMIQNETYRVVLVDAPRVELMLAFNRHRHANRIVVHGLMPIDHEGHRGNPNRTMAEINATGFKTEITVDVHKSSEQIARDIVKRYLPGYVIVCGWAHENNAALKAKAERDTALLKRLASVAGITLDDALLKRQTFNIYDHKTSQSVEVKLLTKEVSLDIRWTSPEKAEKILAILRGA